VPLALRWWIELTERLEAKLRELGRNVPEIEASAVVSAGGLMIASVMPESFDADRVAAMAAAMLSLAERIGKELDGGGFEMGVIQGDRGYIMATDAGEEAAIIALADRRGRLSLAFLEMRRAAEDIEKSCKVVQLRGCHEDCI